MKSRTRFWRSIQRRDLQVLFPLQATGAGYTGTCCRARAVLESEKVYRDRAVDRGFETRLFDLRKAGVQPALPGGRGFRILPRRNRCWILTSLNLVFVLVDRLVRIR